MASGSFSNSLVDTLRHWAAVRPQMPAIGFLANGEVLSQTLTFAELDRQARAIAAQLQSRCAPGERILLAFPSCLEFIGAFLGCLYAGCVGVPVGNIGSKRMEHRIREIAADADAVLALTEKRRLPKNTLEDGKIHTPPMRWLAIEDLISGAEENWRPPVIDADTLAFLQYTSGSTGSPKGVMISHGNLMRNEAMIRAAFGHGDHTVVLGWLPLYHDMGLIGNVLQPLYLGRPSFLMPPEAFLKKPMRWPLAISTFKATTSGAPDFAYDLCVRKLKPELLPGLDLSSWQVAYSGAEQIQLATIERFCSAFGAAGFRRSAFYPCYGMAETTLLFSGGDPGAEPQAEVFDRADLENKRAVPAKPGSPKARPVVNCGNPRHGHEAAVVDPQTHRETDIDEIGEIWVKGPCIAKGYWRNNKLTERHFQARTSAGKGPYLRTGDLGFKRNGGLWITGRLKDLIIVCGQNHDPNDIEQTISRCHEAFRGRYGAVFSVAQSVPEKVIAVQEVSRSHVSSLSFADLIGRIQESVVSSHGLRLDDIVLVKTGAIPLTSSGKIKRFACRNLYEQGSLKTLNHGLAAGIT